MVLYAAQNYEDAIRCELAVDRKRDCGRPTICCAVRYFIGRHQEIANVADKALDVSREDYNCYVAIMNALEMMGKKEAVRNTRQRHVNAQENHIRHVPEMRALVFSLARDLSNGRFFCAWWVIFGDQETFLPTTGAALRSFSRASSLS